MVKDALPKTDDQSLCIRSLLWTWSNSSITLSLARWFPSHLKLDYIIFESIWILTRISLGWKWSNSAISGQVILNPYILALVAFEIVGWGWLCAFFPHRLKLASLSGVSGYFHGKCSDDLHSIIWLVVRFTAPIYHHIPFRRITLIPRIPNVLCRKTILLKHGLFHSLWVERLLMELGQKVGRKGVALSSLNV